MKSKTYEFRGWPLSCKGIVQICHSTLYEFADEPLLEVISSDTFLLFSCYSLVFQGDGESKAKGDSRKGYTQGR